MRGVLPQIPSNPTNDLTSQIMPITKQESEAPVTDNEKEHHVNPATGSVTLTNKEIEIPGINSTFVLERSYSSDHQEIGPFGYGWDFNLDAQLRMYADFKMGEFREDGSTRSYPYVKDDPNAFITSYDGDDKTNYELDKGHYETVKGDRLERVSQYEYIATTKKGTRITYYSYKAPWREGQDPREGKMIRKEDRFGNAYTYSYDQTGNLVEITDTAGRKIQLYLRFHQDSLFKIVRGS